MEINMKIKRKIVIIFVLVVLYGIRVYTVNTDVRLPVREVFEKGEVVSYGQDFNISSNDMCKGYTVQVLDSKIMKAKEFCEKYDVTDIGLANYYYMVRVSVENLNNTYIEEQGVSMGLAMLMGTNYSIISSSDMFKVLNPQMPASSFSLKVGTKKDMWLVFQMIPGNAPDYKQIKKNPPMLQITQYPCQKLIKLL